MKMQNIESSLLPGIPDSIKECVNLGEWLLFKTERLEQNRRAPFYLKTESNVFELSERGDVLREVQEKANKIVELFYFSDVRRPLTLSNTKIL